MDSGPSACEGERESPGSSASSWCCSPSLFCFPAS